MKSPWKSSHNQKEIENHFDKRSTRKNNTRKSKTGRSLFWNEEGFSTVGSAVALLITLSLLFTAARVYEINSYSADIQEVADASALAAENVVGEFYILARVCDAMVFTLSLSSLTAFGIGVITACIPITAEFSSVFLEASNELRQARNTFSQKSIKVLNAAQKALPFYAAAKAQFVFAANSQGSSSHSYKGIALLAPLTSKDLEEPSFEVSDDLITSSDEEIESIAEKGESAEENAKKANELKRKAYEHDCGNKPNYCMYERAESLAGMEGADNPFFSSSETWDFSIPLERTKKYYQKRYENEAPLGSSVAEKSNSALRKRFYAYALEEINKGYVYETEDSFQAYFPLLPKNTEEMRGTPLYYSSDYPITKTSEGTLRMHAWDGCPQKTKEASVGYGSLQQLGSGGFVKCSVCDFSASSVGKIAAASSSVENGFEYHYRIVAECAQEYQLIRNDLDKESKEIKDGVSELFEGLKKALEEAFAYRIEVDPPGKYGVVVLAVDTASPSSLGHFPSSFVEDAGSIGIRAALSSATLVEESSDEGKTIINSFFDGIEDSSTSMALGPAQTVASLWSSLLTAYTEGNESIEKGIEDTLSQIPLTSESGLALWASKSFKSLIKSIGFEPPELRASKAVLVNSSHVLQADNSRFSATLLSVKRASSELNSGSSLFDSALSSIERNALKKIEGLGSEFEIATISLLRGAVEIPITIALPNYVIAASQDALSELFSSIRRLTFSVIEGNRRWE